MKDIKIKNSIILLLTSTIWGTAFVAQSVGMEHLGPFTFNSIRSIIGGIVLIPYILITNKLSPKNTNAKPNANKDILIKGGIACGVLLCLASNFQQLGIKYTTVGRAGFITACYIILVPIISLIFLKKKCGNKIWFAVVLSLIGLYMLCITDGLAIGKGDFLVFICAILFSLHILVIDHYSPLVDGVKMSCIQFFVCGILSLIPALIFEKIEINAIITSWAPILYAGALSSGVAYTLQIVGQKDMNPTIASLILSLESCISVIAGFIILNQELTKRELFGCILMFAAIIIAQLPTKNKVSH